MAGLVLGWDAGVDLETGEGGLAAGGLGWGHALDGALQDLGWVAEVERTTLVVEVRALLELVEVVGSGAEEVAGDRDVLAVGDGDMLSVQKLLGNDGAQTAEHVVAGINDDGGFHSGEWRQTKSKPDTRNAKNTYYINEKVTTYYIFHTQIEEKWKCC